MIHAMTVPAKPPDSASDADEVRAFLAGDEAAFERLVDRHQRTLLHLCQRLVGASDAADLFQEVFLQCYRMVHQLREPEAFRAWLLQITVRRARRRQQARPGPLAVEEPELFAAPAVGDPLELADEVAALRRALERLPPRQREVVVLRHDQGLSFAEIAALLEIREDAARANHYQGMRRLRRELLGATDDRSEESP